MPGQFDKETSVKNFEWHRERVLREKKSPSAFTENRLSWNMRTMEKQHGKKAASEMAKEFNSQKKRDRKYFV